MSTFQSSDGTRFAETSIAVDAIIDEVPTIDRYKLNTTHAYHSAQPVRTFNTTMAYLFVAYSCS